ncbi:HET-domain-containing protein [Lophiostoma macrostomum CBS 122681]|uniref:HET-domain-containing protein n=1 Tax=Lophiostoma macrostomum CBS 122681 TaxID=1314788 RepID=A0A6A6SLH8_9PLEO|nr:HET-domain-containing protein [Lophiostoma macrostomum CBS 122681]
MLCEFCKKIRPPHRGPIKDQEDRVHGHWCIVKHQPNFDNLLESAERGCNICALFRPFVQYAQSKKNKRATEDDDAASTTSGRSHDDPFEYASDCQGKDKVEGPRDTFVYRTKDLVYLDEGHQYDLLDSRGDEKNSALQDQIRDRAEEELKEDIRAGIVSSTSQAQRNEVIQWLMQDRSKYTGPEQLWVKSWIFHGDEEAIPGLQERTSLFALTAGSLEEVSDNAHWSVEYCVDGHTLTNRQAEMALQYPGLWASNFRTLSIPGDTSSHRLKPMFEFFQETCTRIFPDENPEKDSVRAKRVETDSSSTFGMIKDWLSTCVKNHTRCNRAWAPSPTRLVKVLDRNGNNMAKLVESTDELISGELDVDTYAILSHSWGANRSVISTLIVENQQELMHSINVSNLCPTFQDAITIARGIGLAYIWIDALCIIQNSTDDWQHESAMMSAYYQGCKVMISAFSSSSASDRILQSRDLGPMTRVEIHGRYLGIRRLLENADSVASHLENNTYSIRDKILRRPLSERAWTFQEYASAPRIIHFTRDQVIWQCETCLVSEDGQYSMSDNQLPETALEKARKRRDIWIKDKSKNRGNRPTLVSTGWYDIVEKYTARSITFAADILPALAAIAQQVHIVTNSTYCAGLWKGGPNTFYYNLLWETDKPHSTAPHPPPRLAHNGSPSWSWSSIRGKISFTIWSDMHRIPKPYDPKILDISTTLTSSEFRHGKVESGTLDLEGWYHRYTGPSTFSHFYAHRRQVRIERNDANEKRFALDGGDQYLNPLPELSTLGVAEEEESWNDERTTKHYGIGELDVPEENYDWDSGEHIILYISEYSDIRNPDPDDPDSSQGYLILRRCESSNTVPTYQRVGCACANYYTLEVNEERGWAMERIRII